MSPTLIQKIEEAARAALSSEAEKIGEVATSKVNEFLDSLETKLKAYIDEKIASEVVKLNPPGPTPPQNPAQ